MKADHGATPIPLPSIVDDPRWIGRFSREVRKSIAALRDRKIIVRGRQGRGGYVPPWQVTPDGSDGVRIAAGYMFGVIAKGSGAGVGSHGWDFVEVPIAYDGSTTLTGLTGTRYIYASILIGGIAAENQLYATNNPDGIANGSLSYVYGISGSITVYDSASDPATEGADNSLGVGSWIKPLAKVVVTDGIAAVEEQYLTHNPSMHMGFFHMEP